MKIIGSVKEELSIEKRVSITPESVKKFNEYIPYEPGDYCEGATPDPIPNSEVKSFSADGTLS